MEYGSGDSDEQPFPLEIVGDLVVGGAALSLLGEGVGENAVLAFVGVGVGFEESTTSFEGVSDGSKLELIVGVVDGCAVCSQVGI